MYGYLKCVKKEKRKKIKVGTFIIVFFLVCVFEFFLFGNNKIESEDLDNSDDTAQNIEFSSQFIVGVSKDNIIATGNTSSWGSGIIVSKEGYILTNSHVCGNKDSRCYIVMDYDNYYIGNIIWANNDLDLAVVKVNVKFKDCIALGDSDSLRLGQNVYSIGNPINLNFQKSVGKGIVSGLNRSLEFEEQGEKFYMNNLIQTDSTINYGNSGGALIDDGGNLVGINTIKITDADLMGFAVPVNVVKTVIQRVEHDGGFDEASLNIWCYDKYSIRGTAISKKISNGVYVAQVVSDSNSEKAGIRIGDVITHVDTNEINTVNDFREYIFSKNVGDSVILRVNRDNSEIFVNVKLEKAR